SLSNIITPSAVPAMIAGLSVLLARSRPSFSRPVSRPADAALMRRTECASRWCESGSSSRIRARVPAKRAQADLHHIGMIDRYAAAVSVVCDVIQGQDEAIVDVSHAHLSLGDLVVVQVVSACAQQHPVLVELQPCGAQDTLAALEEPDQRLSGVI